jgi:hypothetical protein
MRVKRGFRYLWSASGDIGENNMKSRRRVIGTVVAVTVLAAQPGVAWAATVSGSYLSYLTDLKIRETGRYPGPTGGNIRLCGDQEGSVIGQGGSDSYIMRDISGLPDSTKARLVIEGGRPPQCTTWASTSSNYYYYTKVYASYDGGGNYNGWAKAEKP